MTQKDQAFVANVVVIDSTWKIVVSSVFNQPTRATSKFNAIAKIYKH
jgi:hypothetical protein